MRIRLAIVLILFLALGATRFAGKADKATAAGFGSYLNFSYNATTQTATWQFQYTSQDATPTVQQFNTVDTAATAISATPATCTTTFPTKNPVVCNVSASGTLTLTFTEPIPLACGASASVAQIGGFNVTTQSATPSAVQGSAVGFVLVVPGTTFTVVNGVSVLNNVPAGPACPAGATPTATPISTPIFVPAYIATPVIPVFQNPAAGGLFNPIAKSPTPRPVVAAAPPASDTGGCNPPPGQGVAGICLRPPNTGDAGLRALQDGAAD